MAVMLSAAFFAATVSGLMSDSCAPCATVTSAPPSMMLGRNAPTERFLDASTSSSCMPSSELPAATASDELPLSTVLPSIVMAASDLARPSSTATAGVVDDEPASGFILSAELLTPAESALTSSLPPELVSVEPLISVTALEMAMTGSTLMPSLSAARPCSLSMTPPSTALLQR